MTRVSRLTVFGSSVLCLLILAMAFLAPKAGAGDFWVKQCAGAGYSDFFGAYGQLGGVDRVDVVHGCTGSGSNKIGVYQNRGGSIVPFGTGGQFLWSVPSGVVVYSTSITAKLQNANGIQASLEGASHTWPNADLDEGQAHDGLNRTMRWTDRSKPQNLIIARLKCDVSGGCANTAGVSKAFFEVSDAEFKSTDTADPTLVASGTLWDIGGTWQWHRGNVDFQVNAQDRGAGIARSFLLVNGLQLGLPAVSCPGDKTTFATGFTPCPLSATRSGAASTELAPFQEGLNQVQFCTEDYAATPADSNRACSAIRYAFIDNVAPGSPLGLNTVGGSEWRPQNGFEVSWQNPDGQRSPVFEASYRVSRADDGSLVDSGTVPLGPVPGIGPLPMPEPGEYLIEVKLKDAAGNLGPGASATIRFDDGRPGDVSPEALPGWVSADELPLEQPIERAQSGGPSGVDGYAIKVSRDAPASPCPTGTCTGQDMTLASGADARTALIPTLSEGSHWISAVAASGASLASQNAGSRLVHVDKTVPSVELSGVPAGWAKEPITLTATSTDSGSGMEAKPGTDDGRPVTVIRAGDEAPYAAPGRRASFTVATEGVTAVAYWARDLAGNTNDGALLPNGEFHARPGQATVRIDRSEPAVRISRELDPQDPELVTAIARDSDSGLDRGTILIRDTSASGGFQELDSTLEGNLLSARIPSDRMAAGRYELRARVIDRAGNTGTAENGEEPLFLTLPLKQPTSLSVQFSGSKGDSRAARLNHGKTIEVFGRLTGNDGQGITGARILLEQSFQAGSSQKTGLVEARTDGTGRYAVILGTGPSRAVRVRYQGSRVFRPAGSRNLKLIVRDRVSFRIRQKVLVNGGKAVMTGEVRGKGALRPARGKLIAIQYFDPSRAKWRPVEVIRAGRSGRFRYEYRFRTITAAQRILFRAVSLPEAGWPFKPSTSRRQSVIVYPKS